MIKKTMLPKIRKLQVDKHELEKIGRLLKEEARNVEKECTDIAGKTFNLNSSKQVVKFYK